MPTKVIEYREEEVRIVYKENRMIVEAMEGFDALDAPNWATVAELDLDKLEPVLYGRYADNIMLPKVLGLFMLILNKVHKKADEVVL